MASTSVRVEGADVAVKPIVCQPWCREGDGHQDALFASDQHCWSEDRLIALTVDESIDGGPASWRDSSDPTVYAMVFLDRAPGESTSVLRRIRGSIRDQVHPDRSVPAGSRASGDGTPSGTMNDD